MTRKIEIDEAQLNKEFEDVLDEMYYKYHYHPTNIPHFDEGVKAAGDARFLSSLTDTLSKSQDNRIFVNGLPKGRLSREPYISGNNGEGISGGTCVFFFVFGAVLVGMILLVLYNV